MQRASDLYTLAKEDLTYIVRDVPKWKLVLLAGFAVMFVRGKRKTKWLSLLGLGLLGYHTLEPYFHELEMRTRYGRVFNGSQVESQPVYQRELGYSNHDATRVLGDFGMGAHHYIPTNHQGEPGQYQGNAWYR